MVSCTNLFKDIYHFLFFRFSVFGFMLRSLILLDLSFAHSDKYESTCILRHADIQLNQNHLLKMFSFFHCLILASLNQVSISRQVYSWVFNLSLMINLSVSIPVSYSLYYYCSVGWLEIGDGDSSRSSFVVHD